MSLVASQPSFAHRGPLDVHTAQDGTHVHLHATLTPLITDVTLRKDGNTSAAGDEDGSFRWRLRNAHTGFTVGLERLRLGWISCQAKTPSELNTSVTSLLAQSGWERQPDGWGGRSAGGERWQVLTVDAANRSRVQLRFTAVEQPILSAEGPLLVTPNSTQLALDASARGACVALETRVCARYTDADGSAMVGKSARRWKQLHTHLVTAPAAYRAPFLSLTLREHRRAGDDRAWMQAGTHERGYLMWASRAGGVITASLMPPHDRHCQTLWLRQNGLGVSARPLVLGLGYGVQAVVVPRRWQLTTVVLAILAVALVAVGTLWYSRRFGGRLAEGSEETRRLLTPPRSTSRGYLFKRDN